MSTVTVWTNPAHAVQLVQLSDDPADGTPQEQIAYLETRPYLSGWSCVHPDFTGAAPGTDASLWRWSDGAIVSLPAPDQEPTVQQVRTLLSELGMTQDQLDNLSRAAANIQQ